MEITLKDLLAEIRNLSYLFYGYTVVWVFLLGYLFMLSRRERNLRDQIEELKKSIASEHTDAGDA
ncbi:MAG: CcmD family protein [Chloroflexi bacterium]|nr:CcmD family protein [Chloroflexota bacterium]